MTNKDKAIEMLREFATFQSSGVRGIIRMKRMQADAVALLAKIDKAKDRKKKKAVAAKATGWFADALRQFNGEIVNSDGLNNIFKQISLNNLEKVLPIFCWEDLRDEAIEKKWIVGHGPGVAKIQVPA